jgi:DNA-binding beta-propeller fold protein YncE
MAMSPDGKYLYICQFGNDKSKIKGDTSHHQGAGLAILTTHDLKLVKLPYLGYMTRHVSISPDGRIAYTSQLGDSEVVATDAKTGEILRRLKSAWGPKTNDLTRDGRFLFVANYFGRSLSVIDTKSFQEIARLPFPDRLSGLDVDPEDRYVYVTGWDTGRVWRIRILRQETPNKP